MDWPTDQNDTTDTTVTYRTTFNDPYGDRPSLTIATALAALDDTPPSQTDFILADAVDPDALDELVTDDGHDVTVAFTIDDYRVTTRSNGRVQIRATE